MCECGFKTVCVPECRHMCASVSVCISPSVCECACLCKCMCEYLCVSVGPPWRMQGEGQRERHSSEIADPFTLLPSQGVKNKASRRQWSPDAAKTAKLPPTGTPNPYRQKSLSAQEPYRAELSRERRSHLATICSILCAFRVWNKLVSSTSIYLKGRRVFLRS